MKASLNWLKTLVCLDEYSLDDLDKILSFNIVEVEEIKKLVDANNLVVGHVLECENHPDSDHLHVCQIDLGDKVEQIVCGAPNMEKGKKVIVSKVGAVLPGNFKIKPSKIRGVESNGMCCSLEELGFDEKYIPERFKNGIYLLDDDAKAGDDPLKYLHLDDVMIDLSLTPNRADLLSHLGIAYDLAAVLKKRINYKMPVVHEINKENPVKVSVETPKCDFYSCRYVENVHIMESPTWLKARLITCGIRPINNVVDITNYVMLELGQPLHAFDAKKLGNKIVVRNAKKLEHMNTLDEQERVLDENDCVITDGEKIVAVAGVMGGLESSINDDTTDVIIESAYFDSLSIRKTSQKLQLRSDSSMRFERKIDPARVEIALDRACELLESLAEGRVYKNISKAGKLDTADKKIEVSVKRINSLLGTNISEEEIKDIFDRLGFRSEGQELLNVFVPTRRIDIENYQDLVEEVARIYGYNNIPSSIPPANVGGFLSDKQKMMRNIRQVIEGLGNKEVVTYTLVSKEKVAEFNNLLGEPIYLQMPMSDDRSTVRESQLNGIIDVLSYNKARQFEDISIYEMGRVYYDDDKESTLLSGALTGMHSKSIWQGKKDKVDFYFAKGMLEVLFKRLDLNVTFALGENIPNAFHPGRTADIIYENQKLGIKPTKIGILGNLHPKMLKKYDLNDTICYEINLDLILNNIDTSVTRFKPIPKYPSVSRDIAIVIDKNITANDIISLVKQTGKKTLVEAKIFDVYEGEHVDPKMKSIAISLTFQDSLKTLEAIEVDKKVKSIVDRLKIVYNASLRS